MTAARRSIAFVSRELTPLTGGGIAPVVRTAGELLAQHGWDVTFVTDGRLRERFDELRAEHDPSTETAARWVWVDAPDEHGDFTCWPHLWSARVDEALREAYPDRAPDVVEFSDYLAEGFVTVSRRATRDPWLDQTLVAVRIHTSSELCSVLNGAVTQLFGDRALFEMERFCIEHADRILYQGGDIYETYRRYYGHARVAPGRRLFHALPLVFDADPTETLEEPAPPRADDTLALLYLGRAERRKGIVAFAEALTRRPDLDVTLTIVGGDTESGPLQSSVREHLQILADADPRIEVLHAVPRDEVPGLFASVDALVVSSPWECWPNTALEAMLMGTPVIATPVGGLTELVDDGVTGLLGPGTGAGDLEALVERAVTSRDALRRMPQRPAFRRHIDALTHLETVVEGYAALADEALSRPVIVAPAHPALVSVIVPYFRLEGTLEDTLISLQQQTYPNIEVIVANDGSLRDEDIRLFALAERYGVTLVTGPNGGLSAARNLAIQHARGAYVCPLDADDMLDPTFLERGVRALEQNPRLSYAATWVRYVEDDGRWPPDPERRQGYFPLGNWSSMLPEFNVAGVCTSVMRREVFSRHGLRYDTTLASYEDWDLYQQMAEIGLYGAVIPDKLFLYRVRAASMTRADAQPHVDRLHSELRAARLRRSMTWVATGEPA